MKIFWKKSKPAPPPVTNNKVLVLVDWDNLFFSLFDSFKMHMDLERRLKKMMEWIKTEIGEIIGGYGFVFAPEHLAFYHQQVCVENNFKLLICPKRKLEEPKINKKTGEMMSEEDTVDETIIWYGNLMMRHRDVGFICLVSGDNDYVPLFEEAPEHGVKRVLVPPTINSLSRSKTLIRLTDKNPKTNKKMILVLDDVDVSSPKT